MRIQYHGYGRTNVGARWRILVFRGSNIKLEQDAYANDPNEILTGNAIPPPQSFLFEEPSNPRGANQNRKLPDSIGSAAFSRRRLFSLFSQVLPPPIPLHLIVLFFICRLLSLFRCLMAEIYFSFSLYFFIRGSKSRFIWFRFCLAR